MRRWVWSAILVFLGTAVFTGWFMMRPHFEDEGEYQELVNPSQREKERISTQYRQKVRKDMYLQSQGKRLHTRIECMQSNLMITQGVGEAELAEKMDTLTCIAQEKLEIHPKPWQIVSFFEADEGIYHYASNLFEADDASLYRYEIFDIRLPENLFLFQPEMHGSAKSISLNFGKEVQFTAKDFQASLFDQEGS